MSVQIITGDCRLVLKELADQSVHCCVTSPPYFGLRDYKVDGQIGLEDTLDEYLAKITTVFSEVRRVLRDDGTLWLNLGDSYASAWACSRRNVIGSGSLANGKREARPNRLVNGLKEKDLIGMPWRVAFALQAAGWYLRRDIIWCLSGGTWVYVRTQKGDMPMTLKDVARLDPSTVKLWNGEKWTQLLGMNKSARRGDELEIVLRSGERISCTPAHRFPTTESGLVEADELKVGDTLMSCKLPEPETQRDCFIDEDAAWFAGLYIAEGSRSGDTIQISGHAKEGARWERVRRISDKFGGSATMTVNGNNQSIRVYGKVINAIVDELVTGTNAHDKGFAPVAWRYSDRFIAAMVDGYLSGDGHANGNRWRLGFCRNYNLERDLRTACARLGYTLTINLASVSYSRKQFPTFRGELRKERSGHRNEMDRNEVIEIRKARCRAVYDIGVADEPHLFALASGVLTHNSKPNPMPESAQDRPTTAHEYIFLMTKRPHYFYDHEAIKEPVTGTAHPRGDGVNPKATGYATPTGWDTDSGAHGTVHKNGRREGANSRLRKSQDPDHLKREGVKANRQYSAAVSGLVSSRNKRSVWTVASAPYREAHFATYPPDLIKPCILAGAPIHCCVKCGAPHERQVVNGEPDREHQRACGADLNGEYHGKATKDFAAHGAQDASAVKARILAGMTAKITTGFKPTCKCNAGRQPGIVLDPFGGSGTTGAVALELGRRAILIELNPDYVTICQTRCQTTQGLPLG